MGLFILILPPSIFSLFPVLIFKAFIYFKDDLKHFLCVSLFVQLICSYLFMPVAFMMGIPYEESFTVAELIGTKLFLNEFVAYQKLSTLKDNRLSGIEEVIGGERQWISVCRHSPKSDFAWHCWITLIMFFWCQVRSETITTYALCGFANFSSLGIVIGGLSEYLLQFLRG